MSFLTYSALQAEIAGYLNRDDLTSVIPSFITLAESQMQRRLRTRKMIGRSEATIDNEYELLPSDFAGVRSFELDTTPKRALEYITPDALAGMKASYSTAGNPIYYTIVGDEFQFLPAPGDGQTGSLTYWKKIPALSASNTSNWLLLAHPDAYLYGSLLQSAPYLIEDERLTMWGTLFTTIMDDIEASDRAETFGASMQTRSGNVV
jgi:hypothetical protein